ncbi:MAG: N-formylglutamate amidohydrolase [Sphingomicrobium sp.]
MVLPPPLIHAPRGDLPVLLSVPHSGRDYPVELIALARSGKPALVTLEDPLVDRLAWRALARGCGAVIARTPRAAIDCNRGADELDPAVIEGAPRGGMSVRARGGLGVVPARTQAHGFLWRRTISHGELEQRLADAHRPYHQALESALDALIERSGCALLLDCHSMPPPPAGAGQVVIGDRLGRSAAPWLSHAALAIARRGGYSAGLNDPFAGGYVIARHARPAQGVHALQIELDRTTYLDRSLARPGDGFERAATLLESLAVELGEALLARRFAVAAE